MALTNEQQKVIEFNKQNLIISASAGSGKTFVLIKYITNLIIEKKVPIEKFLVLTFTKAAAGEMKERLIKALSAQKTDDFLLEQIDNLPTSDICTIDSFCEKIIKQNLPKTQLDESFSLLDEKQSSLLMRKAFDRALEEFSLKEPEKFGEVFFAFKKNNQAILECVQSLIQFFDSQEDEEYLIDFYSNNSERIFNDACDYLNRQLTASFIQLSNQLFEFDSNEQDLQNYCQALQTILSTKLEEDYLENVKKIAAFSLPRLPSSKKDEENKARLKDVASELKNIILQCKKYDLSILSIQKQRLGVLSNAILTFYQFFCDKYISLKQNNDCIDFAEAEKIAKKLLKDKEVLQSLQENYAYIFVDEYQDTNRLQEDIIKPIAQKGRFVAVGDIKQGIYGFRNANMEIMLNDIESFSNSSDSQALFLKSNFRSDKKILNFVNFIFEKVMIKEFTGVDYKQSSMLKGEKEFLPGEQPAVQVLLCPVAAKEKACLPQTYSVMADELEIKQTGHDEAVAIAEKVNEFLNSKIYNPTTQTFDQVKPQDIAVLFRGRTKTMTLCHKLLLEKGISAQTDAKNTLFDSPSVKVLISLLKLVLSFKDDVSLVSVLNSPFADFSLNELAEISLLDGENFYEKFEKSKSTNEKTKKFFDFLEDFKFNISLFGVVEQIKKAIKKIQFIEKFSYTYDERLERKNIEEFFRLVYDLDAEFNVPRLVEAFDNMTVKSNLSFQEKDSVLLTTIHATKGLEYPIVIIAGCGDSFVKIDTKPYAISRRFGLATNIYDNVTLTKSPSVLLNATKVERKKRMWVDEIMIFYVALTRAKNHLVLVGSFDENETVKSLEKCSSYFDLLLFALGRSNFEKFLSSHSYKNDFFEMEFYKKNKNEHKNENQRKIMTKKSQNISFKYPFEEEKAIVLKNSVTSLNSVNKNQQSEHLNNDKEISINRGNAMHQAMQLIDFEKISNIDDLRAQLQKLDNLIDLNLIDEPILYNNICLIKKLSSQGTVYKEKEFVMKVPVCELNLFDSKDEIIVQGAIDFFALKNDEIILVDYKYTQSENENILKNRYKKQLFLYEKALNKAFPNKKIKKYLLSLRQSKLIEF